MVVSGLVAGIISVVVGVLVMVWPRIIAFIVGAWLIIIGIIAIIEAT